MPLSYEQSHLDEMEGMAQLSADRLAIFFQALMNSGFTRDEAVQIIVAQQQRQQQPTSPSVDTSRPSQP